MLIRKLLIFTLSCLAFASPLAAQDHEAHGNGVRSPLLKIMTDLGEAMNRFNDGLFKEDYVAIAKAAEDVAAHPQVLPEEMEKISKTLGKDMAKFKQWDMTAHESAASAAKAAKEKKMDGVLKFQEKTMNACISCHTQFRKRVKDALGPK